MRRLWILILLCNMSLVASVSAQDKLSADVSAQEKLSAARQLTPGKAIEREIVGGQAHLFLVSLQQGQFLRAVVTSHDIDIAVTLYGPDGQRLLIVDLLKYPSPEPVSLEAEKGGEYRLEIRAAAAPVAHGRYDLTSEVKPQSQETDRKRMTAERLLIEANDLEREGSKESLQKSLDKRGEALVLWRKLGDRYWEAYSLHSSGRASDSLGQKQATLDLYRAARSIRNEIGDRIGEASTLDNMGIVYDDLGEKQKAVVTYDQALSLRRAMGDKGAEANALINLALVYSELGELQKALLLFSQALSLFREVKSRPDEAMTLRSLAFTYTSLGQYQRALELHKEALALYREMADKSGEATSLYGLGVTYSLVGDNQKALELLSLSLPIFRALGDRSLEASTLLALGLIYTQINEYDKALKYYDLALQIDKTLADLSAQARALNNIGRVYEALGEWDKSLEHANQALPLWRQTLDRAGEADTLNNLGSVYSARGDKQRALNVYEQGLRLRREIKDRRGEAETLNNIGFVYFQLGERNKALEYYVAALPFWRAIGDRGGEAATLDNMSAVYEALGNKPKATELHNLAAAIKGEIRPKERPTLHLIAIGIDLYRNATRNKLVDSKFPLQNLRTAVRDARDIAAALEASSKGAYDQVNAHLLLNSTRAEILAAFDKVIKEAKPKDTIVLSYSGQGFSWQGSQTAAPEYYLMPSDFSEQTGPSDGISATLLRTLFTKIGARRRLIFLDAPQAAVGLEALAKAVAEENKAFTGLLESDVAIVSLSNGPRIELVTGNGQGHGLLSYALLRGSNGAADTDGNGVSVRELAEYARTYVKRRLPAIPKLDPALRQVEVKSFFSGEDFSLTSAKASPTKQAHARGDWVTELILVANNQTQQPQPQKRSEIVGATDTALSRAPRARTGKDYALLIATNTYDHWPGLSNPVVDAKTLEEELKNYYGFSTELLANPTKAEIVAALKKYKNGIKYADDDQFFIFLAGHGTFVDDFREGYIIARNSLKEDPDASSYLSHSQLRNIIDQIPCRHIFLVIDACFGGTFDEKIARRGGDDQDYMEASNLEFIYRKMRFETRQFLTSGGKEYVPDGRPGQHSPFARKLLEALRSYGGRDGILTINRILSYVERVTPEPRRGEWGGNEPGSDFIFIAKPK